MTLLVFHFPEYMFSHHRKLNLYLVFSWQDAAAAIDNMVWLESSFLLKLVFGSTEGPCS